MDDPRKSATKTRGRPFQPGNAGKPKGARHRTTLLAETLMQDDATNIVNAVIAAARKGDMTAARLVLDRIAPARRDSPVTFTLPKIESAGDATSAMAAILAAVVAGEITPSEAVEVGRVVEGFVKSLEASEFERRLLELEEKTRTNEGER
jgi:hypothetical protein